MGIYRGLHLLLPHPRPKGNAAAECVGVIASLQGCILAVGCILRARDLNVFYLFPGLDRICTVECRGVFHELCHCTCLRVVVWNMEGLVSNFVGETRFGGFDEWEEELVDVA